jgi:hypothetical protein
LTARISVRRGGRYELWLGGSFRRSLEVIADGQRVYRGRDELLHDGVDTLLGTVDVAAGTHHVVLRYSAADLSPGSGGAPMPLGPLLLAAPLGALPVTEVRPDRARALCGKDLDWLEAVSP